MRTHLKVIIAAFCFMIFLSCDEDKKDEEKEAREKGYALFCWPSKTACENREYGIEFSYYQPTISVDGITYPRLATMVCCSYIEPLMDSLSAYNDSLIHHRDNQLGSFERSCRIGPDLEVHVSYSVSLNFIKPASYSIFGFKDLNNPYSFDLWVPQFEYFESFRKEVMALYRKCCLQEEE